MLTTPSPLPPLRSIDGEHDGHEGEREDARSPAMTSGSATAIFTPTPPVLQSVAAATTSSAPVRRSDLEHRAQHRLHRCTDSSSEEQLHEDSEARARRADELVARMEKYRDTDGDAAGARLFSLVYCTRPDVLEVAKEAYHRFFSENALNPMAFPSLRRFETRGARDDAVDLFHAPEGAAGSMTSGGTESLLLAVKTARDWARAERPDIKEPEMLLPVTAHPALLKAAHILGVQAPSLVPLRADFTRRRRRRARALHEHTILVVGSAPQYPHGVIDPDRRPRGLATSSGILCHVDACFGGFLLPWVEKLGHAVPPWDFRVRGVTSISADLHKYGYAAKGASTVIYRTRALRRHQYFVHADWPGGLFGSARACSARDPAARSPRRGR